MVITRECWATVITEVYRISHPCYRTFLGAQPSAAEGEVAGAGRFWAAPVGDEAVAAMSRSLFVFRNMMINRTNFCLNYRFLTILPYPYHTPPILPYSYSTLPLLPYPHRLHWSTRTPGWRRLRPRGEAPRCRVRASGSERLRSASGLMIPFIPKRLSNSHPTLG